MCLFDKLSLTLQVSLKSSDWLEIAQDWSVLREKLVYEKHNTREAGVDRVLLYKLFNSSIQISYWHVFRWCRFVT